MLALKWNLSRWGVFSAVEVIFNDVEPFLSSLLYCYIILFVLWFARLVHFQKNGTPERVIKYNIWRNEKWKKQNCETRYKDRIIHYIIIVLFVAYFLSENYIILDLKVQQKVFGRYEMPQVRCIQFVFSAVS